MPMQVIETAPDFDQLLASIFGTPTAPESTDHTADAQEFVDAVNALADAMEEKMEAIANLDISITNEDIGEDLVKLNGELAEAANDYIEAIRGFAVLFGAKFGI